jgi:streptomycin 6-kinase
MKLLKQNITNIFGKEGKAWIDDLPTTINTLATYWGLKQITPVENMTFNYVAKAVTNADQAVVLKIGCDEKSLFHEIQALNYFDGNGSIRLISHHPEHHALLLQQAIPGETLKSLYSSQIEYVMDSYVDTMKKLHNKPLLKTNNYRHIREWLSAIDNLSDQVCSPHLTKKAITLKNELLGSMTNEIFLHGDLHHDNILKNEDNWLAIDPKGVVGDAEFEIAAFDFMYVNELANKNDVKVIFEERVNLLTEKANLNPQRIKDWVFVRLILMAAWHVEDNGDPSWAIKLAGALV